MYSVENIKYKVATLYKNFLCVIKRNNKITCYKISKFPMSKQKRIYIIVDLETLLNKYDTLPENIEKVREALYKILEKNEERHLQLLQLLIEQNSLNGVSDRVYAKRQNYENLLERCRNTYQILTKEEKKYNALIKDAQPTVKTQLQIEMEGISKLKVEAVKTCVILREKLEHTLLSMDKIMFDNTVMLDSVLKNFAVLKSFS